MARAQVHDFNVLIQTLQGRTFQKEHFAKAIKILHERLKVAAKYYKDYTKKMHEHIAIKAPEESQAHLSKLLDMVHAHTMDVNQQVSAEALLSERVLNLEHALVEEKVKSYNLTNECNATLELLGGTFKTVYPVIQNRVLLEQVNALVWCVATGILQVLTHN